MFKNVRKLLEKIRFRRGYEVLFNPTSSEIRRELMDCPELRLIIDPETQNYFVADAGKYTHFDIMKEAKIDSKKNIQGGLYEDGYLWLRGHNIKSYFNKDLTLKEEINWLGSTDFYKNLKSIITDIKIDNYFDWSQT
jgi:hypothetical protein